MLSNCLSTCVCFAPHRKAPAGAAQVAKQEELNPAAQPFQPAAKRAQASTWTPQLAAERKAKEAAEAEAARRKKDSAAAKAAEQAAKRRAEEARLEQEINEKLQEREELRKQRVKAEAERRARQHEAERTKREEGARAREAAASLANAMEGSGALTPPSQSPVERHGTNQPLSFPGLPCCSVSRSLRCCANAPSTCVSKPGRRAVQRR